MLIDWFTVFAQIVNFLALIWLLKIFLYKPILKVIADRQNEINAQLSEAKLKKVEADAESETFRKKNAEFDQQKVDKIKKITEETEQYREKLTSEVKLDAEKQKTKWYTSLENEKDEVFRDLSNKVQAEILSIARKTIVDLSEGKLEVQIVEVFLQRLNKITKKEKEDFISDLGPSDSLQIKTKSDLNEALREKIIKTVQSEFEKEIEVTFIASSDLIAGIELMSKGKKMSWNIADYLSSLESQINKVMVKNPGQNNA
ncbi:MAG: F0F1 ATP synthase subunit B [Parachlamydiaceae bacterium]|nr:F0F1 ATP synthase subunit B [Parachlamydiaceae bacterium]